jgi:hypothetical protein
VLGRPEVARIRLGFARSFFVVSALGMGACIDEDRASGGIDSGSTSSGPPGGCEEGQARECHVKVSEHNGVLTCLDGTQVCGANGVWGECDGTYTAKGTFGARAVPAHRDAIPDGLPADTEYSTKALTDAGSCNNPCDPECQQWEEAPDGGISPDPADCEDPLEGGDITLLPGGFEDKVRSDLCHGKPACISNATCNSDASCNLGTGCCEPYANGYSAPLDPPATVIYAASLTDCIGPAYGDGTDPDACATANNNDSLWIDSADSDGYLIFDLDGTLNGKSVTSVTLRLTAANYGSVSSTSSGEIWEVDPFVRADLFNGAPAQVGLLAADLGAVVNDQVLDFVLPVTSVAANSSLHLEINALIGDGTRYWSNGGTTPPELIIVYDNALPDITMRVPCVDKPIVCNRGPVAAPAGITVSVISANSNTLQNNIGLCSGVQGILQGQCATVAPLAPGDCVMVDGCEMKLNGTRGLIANSVEFPGWLVEETICANNHSVFHPDAANPCYVDPLVEEQQQTYVGACGTGQKPQWGQVAWDTSAPGTASILLEAHTAEPPAVLSAAPPCTDCVTLADIPAVDQEVCPMTGPAPCPLDLYTELGGLPAAQHLELELIWTLTTGTTGLACIDYPVLNSWTLSYSCVDVE